jgi:predicted small lipoprotein YifL
MTLRTFTVAATALVTLGASLTACGKLGELEKPSALAPSASAASPAGASKTTGDFKDPARSPPPQVNTYELRDSAIDPLPPRTIPIPSSGYNPDASEVQGALPDPYANPR